MLSHLDSITTEYCGYHTKNSDAPKTLWVGWQSDRGEKNKTNFFIETLYKSCFFPFGKMSENLSPADSLCLKDIMSLIICRDIINTYIHFPNAFQSCKSGVTYEKQKLDFSSLSLSLLIKEL